MMTAANRQRCSDGISTGDDMVASDEKLSKNNANNNTDSNSNNDSYYYNNSDKCLSLVKTVNVVNNKNIVYHRERPLSVHVCEYTKHIILWNFKDNCYKYINLNNYVLFSYIATSRSKCLRPSTSKLKDSVNGSTDIRYLNKSSANALNCKPIHCALPTDRDSSRLSLFTAAYVQLDTKGECILLVTSHNNIYNGSGKIDYNDRHPIVMTIWKISDCRLIYTTPIHHKSRSIDSSNCSKKRNHNTNRLSQSSSLTISHPFNVSHFIFSLPPHASSSKRYKQDLFAVSDGGSVWLVLWHRNVDRKRGGIEEDEGTVSFVSLIYDHDDELDSESTDNENLTASSIHNKSKPKSYERHNDEYNSSFNLIAGRLHLVMLATNTNLNKHDSNNKNCEHNESIIVVIGMNNALIYIHVPISTLHKCAHWSASIRNVFTDTANNGTNNDNNFDNMDAAANACLSNNYDCCDHCVVYTRTLYLLDRFSSFLMPTMAATGTMESSVSCDSIRDWPYQREKNSTIVIIGLEIYSECNMLFVLTNQGCVWCFHILCTAAAAATAAATTAVTTAATESHIGHNNNSSDNVHTNASLTNTGCTAGRDSDSNESNKIIAHTRIVSDVPTLVLHHLPPSVEEFSKNNSFCLESKSSNLRNICNDTNENDWGCSGDCLEKYSFGRHERLRDISDIDSSTDNIYDNSSILVNNVRKYATSANKNNPMPTDTSTESNTGVPSASQSRISHISVIGRQLCVATSNGYIRVYTIVPNGTASTNSNNATSTAKKNVISDLHVKKGCRSCANLVFTYSKVHENGGSSVTNHISQFYCDDSVDSRKASKTNVSKNVNILDENTNNAGSLIALSLALTYRLGGNAGSYNDDKIMRSWNNYTANILNTHNDEFCDRDKITENTNGSSNYTNSNSSRNIDTKRQTYNHITIESNEGRHSRSENINFVEFNNNSTITEMRAVPLSYNNNDVIDSNNILIITSSKSNVLSFLSTFTHRNVLRKLASNPAASSSIGTAGRTIAAESGGISSAVNTSLIVPHCSSSREANKVAFVSTYNNSSGINMSGDISIFTWFFKSLPPIRTIILPISSTMNDHASLYEVPCKDKAHVRGSVNNDSRTSCGAERNSSGLKVCCGVFVNGRQHCFDTHYYGDAWNSTKECNDSISNGNINSADNFGNFVDYERRIIKITDIDQLDQVYLRKPLIINEDDYYIPPRAAAYPENPHGDLPPHPSYGFGSYTESCERLIICCEDGSLRGMALFEVLISPTTVYTNNSRCTSGIDTSHYSRFTNNNRPSSSEEGDNGNGNNVAEDTIMKCDFYVDNIYSNGEAYSNGKSCSDCNNVEDSLDLSNMSLDNEETSLDLKNMELQGRKSKGSIADAIKRYNSTNITNSKNSNDASSKDRFPSNTISYNYDYDYTRQPILNTPAKSKCSFEDARSSVYVWVTEYVLVNNNIINNSSNRSKDFEEKKNIYKDKYIRYIDISENNKYLLCIYNDGLAKILSFPNLCNSTTLTPSLLPPPYALPPPTFIRNVIDSKLGIWHRPVYTSIQDMVWPTDNGPLVRFLSVEFDTLNKTSCKGTGKNTCSKCCNRNGCYNQADSRYCPGLSTYVLLVNEGCTNVRICEIYTIGSRQIAVDVIKCVGVTNFNGIWSSEHNYSHNRIHQVACWKNNNKIAGNNTLKNDEDSGCLLSKISKKKGSDTHNHANASYYTSSSNSMTANNSDKVQECVTITYDSNICVNSTSKDVVVSHILLRNSNDADESIQIRVLEVYIDFPYIYLLQYIPPQTNNLSTRTSISTPGVEMTLQLCLRMKVYDVCTSSAVSHCCIAPPVEDIYAYVRAYYDEESLSFCSNDDDSSGSNEGYRCICSSSSSSSFDDHLVKRSMNTCSNYYVQYVDSCMYAGTIPSEVQKTGSSYMYIAMDIIKLRIPLTPTPQTTTSHTLNASTNSSSPQTYKTQVGSLLSIYYGISDSNSYTTNARGSNVSEGESDDAISCEIADLLYGSSGINHRLNHSNIGKRDFIDSCNYVESKKPLRLMCVLDLRTGVVVESIAVNVNKLYLGIGNLNSRSTGYYIEHESTHAGGLSTKNRSSNIRNRTGEITENIIRSTNFSIDNNGRNNTITGRYNNNKGGYRPCLLMTHTNAKTVSIWDHKSISRNACNNNDYIDRKSSNRNNIGNNDNYIGSNNYNNLYNSDTNHQRTLQTPTLDIKLSTTISSNRATASIAYDKYANNPHTQRLVAQSSTISYQIPTDISLLKSNGTIRNDDNDDDDDYDADDDDDIRNKDVIVYAREKYRRKDVESTLVGLYAKPEPIINEVSADYDRKDIRIETLCFTFPFLYGSTFEDTDGNSLLVTSAPEFADASKHVNREVVSSLTTSANYSGSGSASNNGSSGSNCNNNNSNSSSGGCNGSSEIGHRGPYENSSSIYSSFVNGADYDVVETTYDQINQFEISHSL